MWLEEFLYGQGISICVILKLLSEPKRNYSAFQPFKR